MEDTKKKASETNRKNPERNTDPYGGMDPILAELSDALSVKAFRVSGTNERINQFSPECTKIISRILMIYPKKS